MQTKYTNQTPNLSQPTKVIEVGKFYLIHDESMTGHPGFVFKKNDTENRYLVILTESDKINQKTKKYCKRNKIWCLFYYGTIKYWYNC